MQWKYLTFTLETTDYLINCNERMHKKPFLLSLLHVPLPPYSLKRGNATVVWKKDSQIQTQSVYESGVKKVVYLCMFNSDSLHTKWLKSRVAQLAFVQITWLENLMPALNWLITSESYPRQRTAIKDHFTIHFAHGSFIWATRGCTNP